jgi:hypothetical protein
MRAELVEPFADPNDQSILLLHDCGHWDWYGKPYHGEMGYWRATGECPECYVRWLEARGR